MLRKILKRQYYLIYDFPKYYKFIKGQTFPQINIIIMTLKSN